MTQSKTGQSGNVKIHDRGTILGVVSDEEILLVVTNKGGHGAAWVTRESARKFATAIMEALQ